MVRGTVEPRTDFQSIAPKALQYQQHTNDSADGHGRAHMHDPIVSAYGRRKPTGSEHAGAPLPPHPRASAGYSPVAELPAPCHAGLVARRYCSGEGSGRRARATALALALTRSLRPHAGMTGLGKCGGSPAPAPPRVGGLLARRRIACALFHQRVGTASLLFGRGLGATRPRYRSRPRPHSLLAPSRR